MLIETKLATLVFMLVMAGYTAVGITTRASATATDLLRTYADRVHAAVWDYAASASSQLRTAGAVQPPASVLATTRHGASLPTLAPNGEPIRIYSYGNGSTATVYAVIPRGQRWQGFGTSITLNAANALGYKAGIVEGGTIRSRAGGWSVATGSLSGFAAADGDLVVRMQTLVGAV